MSELTFDIEKHISTVSIKIKEEMHKILSGEDSRLLDAMRYSSLSDGKCLRPFLTIHTANIYGNQSSGVIKVASAIEIVHSYSLIHDDLPAMDNDDLRRGKASCHIKYDEATAILAGDSLLTLAFEVLSGIDIHSDASIRCKIINVLSKSIGHKGMAGGQMLDLLYETQNVEQHQIIKMLNMKTATLFALSIEVGAILSNASPDDIKILKEYGMKIGLAFQIIDDILDVVGSEEKIGKKTRKDMALGKATLVRKIGMDSARLKATELVLEAKEDISKLKNDKFKSFSKLADFIVNRTY